MKQDRCVLLTVLLAVLLAAVAPAMAADTVVYLVRHAEKVDASRDPALSPAGADRAQALARLLRSSGIAEIHSSDYKRTRDTVRPLAEALGLEVELYDPRRLEAIASKVRGGGTHLVVGHSNTTPQLVRLLGGSAEDMEDSDYDRLYRLVLRDGSVETLLLHTLPICDGAALTE